MGFSLWQAAGGHSFQDSDCHLVNLVNFATSAVGFPAATPAAKQMEQKGRTREQEKDDLMRTPTLTSGDTHVDTPSAETPLNIPWTHSSRHHPQKASLLRTHQSKTHLQKPPRNKRRIMRWTSRKHQQLAVESKPKKKNKCPDGTRWKLTSLMLLNAGVHVCKCL